MDTGASLVHLTRAGTHNGVVGVTAVVVGPAAAYVTWSRGAAVSLGALVQSTVTPLTTIALIVKVLVSLDEWTPVRWVTGIEPLRAAIVAKFVDSVEQ